jgi:predicted nucleic acid-binding protein
LSGFLLDTNIPSEMTKPRPSPQLEQWLTDVDDDQLFMSVISLSEIIRGVTRQSDVRRRAQLQQWLDETLRPWFERRILPVTQPIAERLGRLAGERDSKGKTLPFGDGLIAATALEHDLTLVTRNVRDFADLGLSVINPWDGA